MPRTTPGQDAAEQESVQAAARPAYRGGIAEVDSELVSAYWRRLHAEWEEDVNRLEQAKAEIDGLLDRRFEMVETVFLHQ